MKASPRLAGEADVVDTVVDWETPRNSADNFATRLTGFLIPPVTGEYVFYLCSDDHGELFLSSDESPDNKRLIAELDGWAEYRQWEEIGVASISAPIRLEQGKRYWVQSLFRDGTSRDHLSVTWQVPGGPPPRNGDPPIASEFLEHIPE